MTEFLKPAFVAGSIFVEKLYSSEWLDSCKGLLYLLLIQRLDAKTLY